MPVTALLLSAAFLAGGIVSWIFAYGRGWKASDRMWQAEWDAPQAIDRQTWVDAEAPGGQPGTSPAAIDVRGHRGGFAVTVVLWTNALRPARALPAPDADRDHPVPAEELIARLHAERGQAWVRTVAGVW